jgi:hypothetical protein
MIYAQHLIPLPLNEPDKKRIAVNAIHRKAQRLLPENAKLLTLGEYVRSHGVTQIAS